MAWTRTNTAVAAAIAAVPVVGGLIWMLAWPKEPEAQMLKRLHSDSEVSARGGHWKEAASDLTRVIEEDPTDYGDWWLLMPLLIQSGQTADYKARCKMMLDRFGAGGNSMIDERIAKSCLLLPSAVSPDDMTRVAELAGSALSQGTGSPWIHWFQCTKGLADYRQGQYASALEGEDLARKELAGSGDGARNMCEAESYFVSAMAHAELAQPDEARADLAQGVSIVETKLPKLDGGQLGGVWYDTVTAYILMQEAQQLIEGAAATGRK